MLRRAPPPRARNLLELHRRARLDAGGLRRLPRAAAARARRARRARGAAGRRARRGADRRRLRRGGRDRGEGRERARARLAARPARRSSSPSTAAPSRSGRDGRARPRGRRRPRARAAARRQGPRAGRRGRPRPPASSLAFTDANAAWEPGALRALAAAFDDPEVGYACGQVTFVNEEGTNQEGVYWRYEMWLRANESALASITAGNGAIYAVRREAYVHVDHVMGHDLSFPFNIVKRGPARGLRARGARDGEDGARRSRARARASGA